MNTYVHYLIRVHAQHGLVIDTNLLILYLIGHYNYKLISSFKRTAKYDLEDFRILATIAKPFKKIITTPNILTEVTNLTSSLNSSHNYKLFLGFHHFIKKLTENHITSAVSNNLVSLLL